MTDQSPAPAPKLSNELTWQTIRVLLLFLCGLVLDHSVRSSAVVEAGLAAVTALLTYGYGVYVTWKRTHTIKGLWEQITGAGQ